MIVGLVALLLALILGPLGRISPWKKFFVLSCRLIRNDFLGHGPRAMLGIVKFCDRISHDITGVSGQRRIDHGKIVGKRRENVGKIFPSVTFSLRTKL